MRVSTQHFLPFDDLPGQKYVLQPKGFDLLLVFRSICKVHFEQQKKILSQHHQMKDGFIGPKGWEQKVSNGHIVFVFFDVIFSVARFILTAGFLILKILTCYLYQIYPIHFFSEILRMLINLK